MANRHWVSGGNGNYNSSSNWSATSGGASGASFPTSVDDVFFDALSGVGTATINVASSCRNLNLTGFLGALNFTFNLSTTGTINFGTATYTVIGASALRFQTASTITSNGSSWAGNIIFAANGSFTLVDNFTIIGNLSFESGFNPTLNGNTLSIKSNLTVSNSGNIGGTTIFSFTGTGTWSHTSTGVINNIFTINTAGTLTISGIVYKGSGVFTYTAGTIIDTAGTVAVETLTLNISGFTFRRFVVNGTITLGSNINATTFGTWKNNATSFVLGGNTINFTHLELGNAGTTTLPFAWVCQDIEFLNTSPGVLNGFSITINGNILQSGSNIYSGTTPFNYTGTGTWTATGNAHFSNSFTINTAGTLTFISANLGGGIFTYTAGTVITTGSTLTIRVNGTTMNHGAIIWYNVTTITNVTTFILNNQLVCSNALTLDNSQVTFSGTDGTFDVYYLNLNSSGTVARNPRLVATKTYRVRAGLTSLGTLAFPITLSSTVGASQAILTVDNGSTIDLGFVNATDIDSSLGRPIYSYKGVFSNTLNWGLLPTDNTRSSRSTFA